MFTMTPEKKLRKLLNDAEHRLIEAEHAESQAKHVAAQARETINRCKTQLGLLSAPVGDPAVKMPIKTASAPGQSVGNVTYPVREGQARQFIGAAMQSET